VCKRDQNPEDMEEEALKDCECGKAVVPADPEEMPSLGDASLREGCRRSSDPVTVSSL